jgi:hypothetical protein
MLKSIKSSHQIIGKIRAKEVTGTVSIPNIKEINSKTLQELSQLKISKVLWSNITSLRFELSDGQACQVTDYGFD